MDLRERASRPVDFSRDHPDRGHVSFARKRRFAPRPSLSAVLVTLLVLPVPALAADEDPGKPTTTTTTMGSSTTTVISSTTTTTLDGSTTTSADGSTTTTTSSSPTTVGDDPLVEEVPVDGEFLPLPSIRFPLVGRASFRDTYGAPRDGGARLHNGTDIMADRGTPVVAVAHGVVERMGEAPDAGLYVVIRHSNGWRSAYVHLNNDSPGTDNGLTLGFGPGIEVGARVRAGTLVGWVGDSGNAEDTTPHLHFELHQPDGLRPNPYPALRAAGRFRAFTTLDVVDYRDVELVNAELVSHLFLDGGFNADIAVVDDHAYVGAWGNSQRCPGTGVRIIDILDPEAVSMVGSVADHSEFPGTAAQSLWVGNVSNQFFEGRLGVIGLRSCASTVAGAVADEVVGFAVYDLSDATAPNLLSVLESGTQGLSHLDVSVTPDRITVAGLITLPSLPEGGGGELIALYDVTDPTAPELRSTLVVPTSDENEPVGLGEGTVNWTSRSQVSATTRTGSVLVADVSDLANPVVTAVDEPPPPTPTESGEDDVDDLFRFTQRVVDIGPLGKLTASLSDGARIVDRRVDGVDHIIAKMIPGPAFDPQLWWTAPDGSTEFAMVWDVSSRDGLVYVSDHHSGLWVFRLTVANTAAAGSVVAD